MKEQTLEEKEKQLEELEGVVGMEEQSLSDKLMIDTPGCEVRDGVIKDIKKAVKELKEWISLRKKQYVNDMEVQMLYSDIELKIDEIFGRKLI